MSLVKRFRHVGSRIDDRPVPPVVVVEEPVRNETSWLKLGIDMRSKPARPCAERLRIVEVEHPAGCLLVILVNDIGWSICGVYEAAQCNLASLQIAKCPEQ